MTAMPQASRPYMPGYGILPADQGAGLLPWALVEEQMAAARNYWVASTRPDGRPHVVPVWGLWHAGTFFFSTGADSRKGRNLAANPAVVVHLESGDDVVILEGRVERESSPSQLKELDQAYQGKYDVPMLMEDSPIFRLQIERALAWREADFPGSATRWVFE